MHCAGERNVSEKTAAILNIWSPATEILQAIVTGALLMGFASNYFYF